jgi:hypothetical protein
MWQAGLKQLRRETFGYFPRETNVLADNAPAHRAQVGNAAFMCGGARTVAPCEPILGQLQIRARDITVERIGDLLHYGLPALLDAALTKDPR